MKKSKTSKFFSDENDIDIDMNMNSKPSKVHIVNEKEDGQFDY